MSPTALEALVDRRRFITIGGFSVATAALIAACGQSDSGGIARVGVAPTVTALPDAVVGDIVLLRTASSLEHSIADVYEEVLGDEDLLDQAEHGEMMRRFREAHLANAEVMERLTAELGGEPWTCGNPRLDDVVFVPIFRAIRGQAASETSAATPPSDDPKRDVLNFVHALESVAGATHQSLIPILSDPALRKEAATIGASEVRHAALLAITITGAPEGYANPADVQNATMEVATTVAETSTTQNIAAPTTAGGGPEAPAATPVPPVYAMPGRFAKLGATQLVVGAPSEAGTRLTVNLETPSLNSFVYEYMSPSCEA